ncbi:MAG: protein-L-isoaspartate(D-aspartate) O-methyltransferase [Pseudomonadales bacterium]|nr:protein-L-isoaspartate(D-aspartate) O-methyltransferase [Pseudomonadales bacterium]
MADLRGVGMTSQRTRNRLAERLREQGVQDELVLDVIRSTPRHMFVDEALASRAYDDTSLPIGFNQTISQPYTVARMTEVLLAGGQPGKVLEIGTGSGYQTAVLSQLVERVYTVERIAGLAERSREILKQLGYRNIQFKYDDGNIGWPDRGPFDGIIVTASPRTIPAGLISQLAPGGRLVIPVGTAAEQSLKLVVMTDDGPVEETLEAVNFVPLLGGKV